MHGGPQRLVRLEEFYTKPDHISCLPRQVCTDLLELSFMESRREIGPSFTWPNNDSAALSRGLIIPPTAGTPAAAAPLSVAATSSWGGVAVAVAAGVAGVGGCSGGNVRAVDAALLFFAVGSGGISSSEETLFHTL